ncbi:DUF6578 domain-containing protein [Leifsonia sp. McL0607]|uniref:DUF6578 domain-containing protein n=1 Tax=Leifsonia sp. McL0607 TaxID=3415672 RepID=UPI003CF7F2A2
MESTTIEVLVWSSDYGCCGAPFAVGDDLRFTLVRMVDETGDRYWDDRHPMDDDTPRADVGGRVEAIVATYERMVPVAGAHYLTNDPSDTLERVVEAVPAAREPEGYGGATYRVTFRIPVDAALPDPRPPSPPPERYASPEPERTLLLKRLVEEVEERFADAVEVLRERDDTSVTLASPRKDAAAVRWNLSDSELFVEVERAEWRLPWTADALPTLRHLIDAAASGGFSETVEDDVFVSIARAPSGATLTASAQAPSLSVGGGLIMVPGPVRDRLVRTRSGRPYPPW